MAVLARQTQVLRRINTKEPCGCHGGASARPTRRTLLGRWHQADCTHRWQGGLQPVRHPVGAPSGLLLMNNMEEARERLERPINRSIGRKVAVFWGVLCGVAVVAVLVAPLTAEGARWEAGDVGIDEENDGKGATAQRLSQRNGGGGVPRVSLSELDIDDELRDTANSADSEDSDALGTEGGTGDTQDDVPKRSRPRNKFSLLSNLLHDMGLSDVRLPPVQATGDAAHTPPRFAAPEVDVRGMPMGIFHDVACQTAKK